MSVVRNFVLLGVIAALAFVVFQVNDTNAENNEDAISAIRAYAEANYGGASPGAAISVLDDGEVIFLGGFGMADLEWKASIEPSTSFRIGSISKPFTAIAVLHLVEQGRVDLDQPISIYLEDLPGLLGQPTVRQLLSHTSGLPEHFALPEIPVIMRNPIAAPRIVDLMADAEFMFEPGSAWAYSNFNYVLLGLLIEAMDEQGRDYGRYIEQELFRPMGMENSHYDRQTAIIERRAQGYDNAGSGPMNTMTVESSLAYAAGALMSSAEDMAIFSRALINGELLSDEMRELAWTDTLLNDESPTGYGLGFNVDQFMGEQVIWHSGSTNGFQATWIHMPAMNRTVSVLSNGYYLPNSTSTARRILAELAGNPVPVFEHQELEDAGWQDLQGRYQLEDGRLLQVHVQGGMRANFEGGGWREFSHAGGDIFFRSDTLSYIEVERTVQGNIAGLIYYSTVLERLEATPSDGAIEGAQIAQLLDPEEAAAVAGNWRLPSGDSVVVSFDDGIFGLQVSSQPEARIFSAGDGVYFQRGAPVSISFSQDHQSAELNMYWSVYVLSRD